MILAQKRGKTLQVKILAFLKRKPIIFVICIWLLIQVILFHFLGISHGGDTVRYLEAAKEILNGAFPSGKAVSYLGYDYFVAIIFGLGLGEGGVIAIQLVFSLISIICLYKLTTEFTNNKKISLIAIILYVLSIEIHSWNFYILTDSLFTSMTIISLYFVASTKKTRELSYVIPILLWTALIRPTGFVVLMAAIIFCLTRLIAEKKNWLFLTLSAILIIGSFCLFNTLGRMVENEKIVDHYLRGEVIWGYSRNLITIPSNVYIDPNVTTNSISGIFLFIKNNLILFIKLASYKFIYLFGHIKPFYSVFHNWTIIATYYPMYIFALIGISKRTNKKALKLMLLAYLLIQVVIVMMTFEDWDGRFLEAIMPPIYVFSAIGLFDFVQKSKEYFKMKLTKKI